METEISELWNRKKSAEQDLWSPLHWYGQFTAVPGDPDFFSSPNLTFCYHVHQPNTNRRQRMKGSIGEVDSRSHPRLWNRAVKSQELMKWGQKYEGNGGFGGERSYGMKGWVRRHSACQLRRNTVLKNIQQHGFYVHWIVWAPLSESFSALG